MTKPNIEKLLRYIKEETTAEESHELESWMEESPSNKEYVETLTKAYYAKKVVENIEVRQKNASKSLLKLKRRIKQRRMSLYFKRIGQISAAIALVLLLSTVIAKTNILGNQTLVLHEVSVKANPGMRTDVVLPDGTHIWLNSNSEIKYNIPFDRNSQEIELIGQAFFDVAHNPNEPFKINVNKELSIKVLGTKFNVVAYPQEQEIQVLLTQGSVAVDNQEKSNFHYTMEINDELTYNRISESYNVVKKNNAELYTSWTENKLVFRNTPITEVFKQLSRYYDVKISIEDIAIEKYRFTGIFNNKTLPYILQYIELTSNLRYEQEVMELDGNENTSQEHFKIYNRQS